MKEEGTDKRQDFYQKIRKQIQEWGATEKGQSYKWGRWILLAPDLFHLLIRLVADPEVSSMDKAKLVVAIAYYISPIDLIPELFLGPPGFLDDIVVASYALNSIINHTDPAFLRKYWAGEQDILHVVQSIIINADQMLGSGLMKKIRKMVGK